MKKNKLLMTAKIISIVYIILITALAFDEKLFSLGFLIHLIPTIIFTGILIFAWFKPKFGGIVFAIAGLGTILVFNTYRELIPFLAISLIPIITGILFYLSHKKH